MDKKNSLRILIVYVLLILVFILTARFHFRFDLTRDHMFTLSSYTKEILSNLDSEVKITWYRSNSLVQLTPAVRHIEDLLQEYHEFSKGKVVFSIINPDISANAQTVTELGFVSRQISFSEKGNSETDVYSGLLIEYAGQHRTIPFLSDQETLEYDMTRLILELQNSSDGISLLSNTVNLLYGTSNANELYPYVEPWITYAGYAIEKPVLPVTFLDKNKPLLVIGSASFDQVTVSAIDTFLASGGNAVFFLSGNKVNVSGNWKATPKTQDDLLSTLSLYGITIATGLLIDTNNFRITMPSIDNTKYEYINYPFWITTNINNSKKERILSGTSQLQFFWPSYIYLDKELDKSLSGIVSSSKDSLIMDEPYDTDPFGKQISLFSESKKKGPEFLAATSTKKGRVAFIADEYFPSKMIEYTGSDTNLNFVVNCVEWITGKDKLLELKHSNSASSTITESDTATITEYFALSRFVNLILIPACILILFLLTYFFRKRKK